MSGEKVHIYLQARMFLLLSVNCQFLQNQQFHVSKWSDGSSDCGWGNERLTLITSAPRWCHNLSLTNGTGNLVQGYKAGKRLQRPRFLSPILNPSCSYGYYLHLCQIILNNLISVGWPVQFPQEENPRTNKLTACQGARGSELFRFMHHKETDIFLKCVCVCKCVYTCTCKCASIGVHIYVRTRSPPWVLFLRNHLPCVLREYLTGTWVPYCD